MSMSNLGHWSRVWQNGLYEYHVKLNWEIEIMFSNLVCENVLNTQLIIKSWISKVCIMKSIHLIVRVSAFDHWISWALKFSQRSSLWAASIKARIASCIPRPLEKFPHKTSLISGRCVDCNDVELIQRKVVSYTRVWPCVIVLLKSDWDVPELAW